jgi:hypothetical protein
MKKTEPDTTVILRFSPKKKRENKWGRDALVRCEGKGPGCVSFFPSQFLILAMAFTRPTHAVSLFAAADLRRMRK